MFNRQKCYRVFGHNSKGFSLIEVIVALALLGIIGVAFFGGLATASKAIFIADERATAESLARSQMEYVKSCEYEAYDPDDPPSYATGDEPSTHPTHPGYFIWIDAFPIHPDTGALLINPDTGDFLINPDTGNPYEDVDIQKIIVTVKHGTEAETAKEVITLEDYKVDR